MCRKAFPVPRTLADLKDSAVSQGICAGVCLSNVLSTLMVSGAAVGPAAWVRATGIAAACNLPGHHSRSAHGARLALFTPLQRLVASNLISSVF